MSAPRQARWIPAHLTLLTWILVDSQDETRCHPGLETFETEAEARDAGRAK